MGAGGGFWVGSQANSIWKGSQRSLAQHPAQSRLGVRSDRAAEGLTQAGAETSRAGDSPLQPAPWLRCLLGSTVLLVVVQSGLLLSPLTPFASLFQAKGTHFPQPLGASARLHFSSSMSVLYWGAKMGFSGAAGAEERAVITSIPQRMLWLCCQGPRLADATWRTGPCRVPSGFCQPGPLGPTDWQPCPRALQHVLPMWCHLQTWQERAWLPPEVSDEDVDGRWSQDRALWCSTCYQPPDREQCVNIWAWLSRSDGQSQNGSAVGKLRLRSYIVGKDVWWTPQRRRHE